MRRLSRLEVWPLGFPLSMAAILARAPGACSGWHLARGPAVGGTGTADGSSERRYRSGSRFRSGHRRTRRGTTGRCRCRPPAPAGRMPAHRAEHGLGQPVQDGVDAGQRRARRGREPAQQGAGEQDCPTGRSRGPQTMIGAEHEAEATASGRRTRGRARGRGAQGRRSPFSWRRWRSSADTFTFDGVTRNTLSATRSILPFRA